MRTLPGLPRPCLRLGSKVGQAKPDLDEAPPDRDCEPILFAQTPRFLGVSPRGMRLASACLGNLHGNMAYGQPGVIRVTEDTAWATWGILRGYSGSAEPALGGRGPRQPLGTLAHRVFIQSAGVTAKLHGYYATDSEGRGDGSAGAVAIEDESWRQNRGNDSAQLPRRFSARELKRTPGLPTPSDHWWREGPFELYDWIAAGMTRTFLSDRFLGRGLYTV